MKEKLLVVDDDEQILKQLKWALSEDYQIHLASDRPAALQTFRKENISVVLLDLGLPPHPREAAEGLEALREMLAHNPLAKVIIVSGNAERQNALRAIDLGAHDIFPKPVEIDQLKVVLARVGRRLQLERESMEERELVARVPFEEMIGSSSAMKAVFSAIRKVADKEVPVLISGESGTGKEMVANAIHKLSPRNKGPFVAINCAAIPETLLESELFGHEKGSFTGASIQRRGKFEYAHRGTLFLDEIGDLAPELQVKILRFLQEKIIERVGGRQPIPVDTRVIAATHRDLETAVKEDKFREDLYFRLAVVKIPLPPLRERGNDVIQIAMHFLDVFARELKIGPKRLSAPAVEALRRHDWPGNVRELQNRVKQALVLAEGKFITPADLELEAPPAPARAAAGTLKQAKEEVERELISKALAENDWNITKAAKALGISRPTLYDLMSRHGLSAGSPTCRQT